jgi:hypothetical protein
MMAEDNVGRGSADVDISEIVTADAVTAQPWGEEEPIEVRYPLPGNGDHDRSLWPWLPGTILAMCGPDEWQVCVEVRELATLEDGRPPHGNTSDHELFYPVCFRDSSEIRARTARTGERRYPVD